MEQLFIDSVLKHLDEVDIYEYIENFDYTDLDKQYLIKNNNINKYIFKINRRLHGILEYTEVYQECDTGLEVFELIMSVQSAYSKYVITNWEKLGFSDVEKAKLFVSEIMPQYYI